MGLVFSIKQRDRTRSLVVDLFRSDGSTPDLSGGATGRLILTPRGQATPSLNASVMLDNSAKTATYPWQAADVANAGEWLGEIEILKDGLRETFPGTDADGNPAYLVILIVPDLGDAP